MIKVEVVRDQADFRQLQEKWDLLLERSSAVTIFQTYEWYATWIKHFGSRVSLFVLVAREDEDVQGIAPLMIYRRDGFRQLGLIAGRTVDYEDFILADGCDQADMLNAFWDVIQSESGWDIFQLNKMREDSPTFQRMQAVLAGRNTESKLQAYDASPYLTINQTWANYWQSLPRDFRRTSLRRERKLAQEHGPVSYGDIHSPEDVDILMPELFRMHLARRRKVSGTPGVFGDTRLIGFYNELSKQLLGRGWVHMFTLWANNHLVASQLTFEFRGVFLQAIPAFDEAFSTYSVGRLLNIHVVKSAFLQGLKEVDFLRGTETYKVDFCPKVRQLYSLSIFSPTMRGYLGKHWFGDIRPGLRRTREALKSFPGTTVSQVIT